MSTWRPPWSAQGQFKLTLLPPTRASNPVTARRPPRARIDGRARRRLAGPRHPRPARRSGLAGRVPDRPRPCQATAARPECSLAPPAPGLTAPRRPGSRPRVGPGGAEPFGPRPARPAPTTATQHHTSGGPGQASTDPTRPQRPDRRVWPGRAAFALLGWGTIQAWLCRDAMADAAPPVPDRWCAPSATPEPAPRTAAPPGSPGTTPLGAARSTKDGTGRE
jgi:hypothetical protein